MRKFAIISFIGWVVAIVALFVIILRIPAHAQETPPSNVELYNRVLQNSVALGAVIRAMTTDVAALVNSMQKESIMHVEQLAWWNGCAKRSECLDWLKSGIGQ